MTSLCRWEGFVDTCVFLAVMLKLIPIDLTKITPKHRKGRNYLTRHLLKSCAAGDVLNVES